MCEELNIVDGAVRDILVDVEETIACLVRMLHEAGIPEREARQHAAYVLAEIGFKLKEKRRFESLLAIVKVEYHPKKKASHGR